MPLTPNGPSGRERGDEGFTLLETLVEVLLVAVALGVLAGLAGLTFEAWKRASTAVEERASSEVLLAALEKAVAQIRVPFSAPPAWGRAFVSTDVGRPWIIPWYRGNPDASLELGTDGHRVWLRSWDVDLAFSVVGARFSPWVEEGRVIGVVVEFSHQRAEFAFGALPSPGVPHP